MSKCLPYRHGWHLRKALPIRPCDSCGQAADSEDGSLKHVAMENRLYPFRELLGELLLEMGQPAAA